MYKRSLIYCYSVICALIFSSCSTPRTYKTIDGIMLGTTVHVVADVESTSSPELYSAVMKIDKQSQESMSIFNKKSLISRLNSNQTDSVDSHIKYNLELAHTISELSDGIYDVTVKPLVEAWGFAGSEPLQNPNIDSILDFVGYKKVKIEGGILIKEDPRIELDFNSIAKGYIVDLVANLVDSLGAENYIVEIGGEVRCKGVNESGNSWRIGIETPYDGNNDIGKTISKKIKMSEGGLATSGNYRRFYLNDKGEKIAHTIDPRTGRSAISSLLSVTVIAENCATADVLGTMFLAMGTEKALELAKNIEDIKVYFIIAAADGKYEEYISPQMEQLIINDN